MQSVWRWIAHGSSTGEVLVWFPDPSCMGGARVGSEGSGE